RVSPGEQKKFSVKLEQIGKGKTVGDLTLGQIVGLYREANLFDHAEKALGKRLPHISTANFNNFIDIRNRAVHKGEEISPKASQFFAAQLALFIDELGLGGPARPSNSETISRGEASPRPWVEIVAVHSDVVSES